MIAAHNHIRLATVAAAQARGRHRRARHAPDIGRSSGCETAIDQCVWPGGGGRLR